MATILIDRKIGRLEKAISILYEDAYHAYWNGPAYLVRPIEAKIKALERQLQLLHDDGDGK